MKASKTVKRLFAAFIAVLIFVFSFGTNAVTGETFSDAWVLEYKNMEPDENATDVVPSLYKNDAAFGNHRRFPLVVYENVHYVPVEMFSGLSGIRLTYGYSIDYFYLATQGGTRYISFDIQNNAVTTHEKQTYTLVTKVFYNTRYLPAKEVADVLGLNTEIYRNEEEGIYALRLSDSKAKGSFSELIRMYSPIKKDETKPPEVTENVQGGDTSQTVPDIGRRSIYVTFDVTSFSGLSDTLSVLERQFPQKSAVFFVKAEDILKYPDEMRQILAYGQNIGILLTGDISDYKKANENLRLVTKTTTRLVRFASGSTTRALTNEQYESFVEENGVCVWDYNINLTDSRSIYDSLYALSNNARSAKAVIRIPHNTNADTAVLKLREVTEGKRQLTVYTTDETATPFSYR